MFSMRLPLPTMPFITRLKLFLSINLIKLLCCHPAFSAHAEIIESAGMKLRFKQVANGFGVIWGMAFLDSNRLLMTEREGSIKLLDIAKRRSTEIKNAPEVLAQGQGGMLDVVLAPDFAVSGWIYFTYVKDIDIESDGVTVLTRAKLKDDALTDWQELLVTRSGTDTSQHFGSRIAFDEDGHVYFGIGDRGVRENSQDLSNHAGSIMRLNIDGSVPSDNPHKHNKKWLAEVWSIGHRNPQGMAYDAVNNRLWSIEHGPRGGDELNLIKKGANYGWPVISYGKEYWGPIAVGEGTHREGMEQPVKVYTPSIAPGSLLYYSGDALPGWKGNLFSGALKLRHLNRIVISEQGKAIQEERLLEDMDERIRALAQGPQGWLYFSTDSGSVYRLSPVESRAR